MPISSSEIAAMNGGFLQQSMAQNQYASQIGQGSIYGGGGASHGDQMMGSMMNRGSAIGGPVMSGAMGLLGLDPMSIGLKAGIGAYGAGAGVGGAAMVGAGVALPAMAVGAAAHYAGSQMYTGAQQQQTMNNVLQQSFGFRNQQGGRGFERGEMSSIGSMVREMSHNFGPGGEVAGMGELTQLAGKMGSMGFATGVRDVKEFGTKFKEMVKTLKTMATDLGSTLEGAMEFAAAAKGSGMFGMGRTQAFTSAARGAAVSGGLAMSEVTGAASIGSQISRSIGGLGRQGAMAGVKTIGQIGTAQQMGVLSEEDIYNATGQTGAEGRQAFAASSMQRTGKFLQTGRGRRMLASMADKDGNLDEGMVSQFMSGGMGIGETMAADHKQLGKVGRANFIRNEGRLRGAALEKIGGFGDAMQLSQWASSKGIDINNMDDRSMLFAQRQLGMGRDEMDAAVKMVNNMPQIVEQQRRSEQDDGYFQKLAQSRKQRGVEGVKNRFEQAKETVNGKLQKVGQDLFNEGAQQIDEFMNKLTGTYVQTYSKDVDDQYRAMRSGGSGAAFGVGGGGVTSAARGFSKGGLGMGGGAPGMLAQMRAGSDMNLNQALQGKNQGFDPFGVKYAAGLGGFLAHGQSDMSKLKEAGYDMSGVKTDAQAAAKLNQIQAMQRAAATGFNEGTVKMGAGNGDWIRNAYVNGDVTGKGEQRLTSFGTAINKSGNKQLQAEWAAAGNDPVKQAQVMANLERGAGIKGEGSISQSLGLPDTLRGVEHGKFSSVDEENRAYGNLKGFGRERTKTEKAAKFAMQALLGNADPSGSLSKSLVDRLGGSGARDQAVGTFLKGAEGRDAIAGLLSTDAATRAQTREGLQLAITNDPKDKANDARLKMLDAGDYQKAVIENHGQDLTPEQQKAFTAAHGGRAAGSARDALGTMVGVLDSTQRRDMAKAARGATVRANKEADKLSGLGIYDAATGGLAKGKAEELAKMGGNASRYAELALFQTKTEMGYSGTEAGAEGDRMNFRNVQLAGKDMSGLLAGMSVKEKRALASTLGGSEGGAEAGRSASMQSRVASLSRKRGTTGAAAGILGVEGLSQKELQGMDLGGDGAGALLARAGITDKDTVSQLQKGAKGGQGSLAEALRGIVESPAFKEAQKKKQTENAENADPLQAAIKRNGERTNELMTKLVTYAGLTADEIGKLKAADPEKKTEK